MRANNSSISISYVEMDINFKCVFIPLVHWNAKQEVRPATQAVLYSSTCTFLLYFLISTMLPPSLKKPPPANSETICQIISKIGRGSTPVWKKVKKKHPNLWTKAVLSRPGRVPESSQLANFQVHYPTLPYHCNIVKSSLQS